MNGLSVMSDGFLGARKGGAGDITVVGLTIDVEVEPPELEITVEPGFLTTIEVEIDT